MRVLEKVKPAYTLKELPTIGLQGALNFLLILLLVSGAFTAPVAAQGVEEVEDEFLCADEDSRLVQTLENLLTVLIVAGPVLGTVMAAGYTVALTAKDDVKYREGRKRVLIAGWSVLFVIYGLEILATTIVGIDISCIVP